MHKQESVRRSQHMAGLAEAEMAGAAGADLLDDEGDALCLAGAAPVMEMIHEY